MNDEIASKRASIIATNSVNEHEKKKIQLDNTTEAFRKADMECDSELSQEERLVNYFNTDPSARQYLNTFQPPIPGRHTGGKDIKNRIPGTGGYTIEELDNYKTNKIIIDYKYHGK